MDKRRSPAADRYRPASRITFTVRRNGQPRLKVPNSHAAAKLLTKSRLISDDGREHFGVFLLDHQSRLLGYYKVAVGTHKAVMAAPREIFAAALRVPETWGIILVHNHVIGSALPSQADRKLTRHLSKIGAALDVLVLDHLILSMNTRDVYWFACANEARARKKRARLGQEFDRAIDLRLKRCEARRREKRSAGALKRCECSRSATRPKSSGSRGTNRWPAELWEWRAPPG
jgi:DNA repair protein RadC